MKKSVGNFPAMNPVTTENMGKTKGKPYCAIIVANQLLALPTKRTETQRHVKINPWCVYSMHVDTMSKTEKIRQSIAKLCLAEGISK